MYYWHYQSKICIHPETEYYVGRILTRLFSTVDLCCKDTLLLLHEAKYKVSKDKYGEIHYRIVLQHLKKDLQKALCEICEKQKTCRETQL